MYWSQNSQLWPYMTISAQDGSGYLCFFFVQWEHVDEIPLDMHVQIYKCYMYQFLNIIQLVKLTVKSETKVYKRINTVF